MRRSSGPSRALFVLFPALLPATFLPASVAAQEPVPLESIIVSASRVELPADSVGSSVTEIGGEELQRRGVQRLEDVLDLVPGVTVRRTGSIGTPAGISLRGLGVRNTLVLLDGVEIGDPSRAQVTYEFGTIPVADIDRIEVLRGPQSTLYGADAAGGVINIVTRRPTRPFEGYVGSEVGTWGTVQGSAGIRGTIGRFTYGASAFGFRTDGFSSFPKARGGRERDGHETWSGRAQFGVDLTDTLRTELWLSQSEARVDYDQSNADLFQQYFTKRERFLRSQTTFEAFDGRWKSQFGIAHSSHQRDYKGSQNVSLGDHYDGTRTKIDYLGNVRIAPGHAITFGAEGSGTGSTRTRRPSWAAPTSRASTPAPARSAPSPSTASARSRTSTSPPASGATSTTGSAVPPPGASPAPTGLQRPTPSCAPATAPASSRPRCTSSTTPATATARWEPSAAAAGTSGSTSTCSAAASWSAPPGSTRASRIRSASISAGRHPPDAPTPSAAISTSKGALARPGG